MALVLFAATAAGQERQNNLHSTPVNDSRRQSVDVVFIGTDCGCPALTTDNDAIAAPIHLRPRRRDAFRRGSGCGSPPGRVSR